jgi:hypothetical protein
MFSELSGPSVLHLKFGGFGIDYGIGRKYWPIRVSVLVSDVNQNSGFGRSLKEMVVFCQL